MANEATSPKNSKGSSNSKAKNPQQSTLNFVEISEIRDSVYILREGQMRAVLGVSSANFALKSLQEQEIIVNNFQGVLNSLEFPIQILVRSRRLDINPYINKLKSLEDKQKNDLLRVKMQEYIEYIKEMSREVNIMDKKFYIIVGYEPISLSESLFGRFLRALNAARAVKQKQEEFIKNRKILMNRVDQVASKLGSLDLKVDLLNTQELISLAYSYYNPDALESITLGDIKDLEVEMD